MQVRGSSWTFQGLGESALRDFGQKMARMGAQQQEEQQQQQEQEQQQQQQERQHQQQQVGAAADDGRPEPEPAAEPTVLVEDPATVDLNQVD